MSRPRRLEIAEGIFHLGSRGNRREAIFADDDDRRTFLAILGSTIDRYEWRCHAYCLMANHYHLVIQTPRANLADGMAHLNGQYSRKFNHRHSKIGHLFHGRYFAVLVQDDAQFLTTCAYVVLNQVRAGLASHPLDGRWNSYAATAGLAATTGWLTTDMVLGQLHEDPAAARAAYRTFIGTRLAHEAAAGAGANEPVPTEIVVGDDTFRADAEARAGGLAGASVREIPSAHRHFARPLLDEIFGPLADLTKHERASKAVEAFRRHGYTMGQISRHLGIHVVTVSRIIRADEERRAADRPAPRATGARS